MIRTGIDRENAGELQKLRPVNLKEMRNGRGVIPGRFYFMGFVNHTIFARFFEQSDHPLNHAGSQEASRSARGRAP